MRAANAVSQKPPRCGWREARGIDRQIVQDGAPAAVGGDGDHTVLPAFADEDGIARGAGPERVVQPGGNGSDAPACDVEDQHPSCAASLHQVVHPLPVGRVVEPSVATSVPPVPGEMR